MKWLQTSRVDRLLWIARRLRRNNPITAALVARKFKCSQKTVYRDINYMRERLGYHFDYSSVQGTYVLHQASEPVL